jgi:hypothetical protein
MNKNELVRYVSDKFARCIQAIPEDILEMDVDSLEMELLPTKKDRMLKVNLQNEITRAEQEHSSINNVDICRGVCHVNHFLRLMENTKKLAWMLMPASSNELRLTVQNDWADERLEEILRLGIFDENGNFCKEKADLVMKAIKMVKDRTVPIVSRSEVKQLQVKANLNKEDNLTDDEIDKKLRKLVQRRKAEVIEITGEEAEGDEASSSS